MHLLSPYRSQNRRVDLSSYSGLGQREQNTPEEVSISSDTVRDVVLRGPERCAKPEAMAY